MAKVSLSANDFLNILESEGWGYGVIDECYCSLEGIEDRELLEMIRQFQDLSKKIVGKAEQLAGRKME